MGKVGLVLTGGGARAAYQAGVLRGIWEITQFKEVPFPIVSGISAGAINGSYLAGHMRDFEDCTRGLWNLWESLTPGRVFKLDPVSIGRIALRLLLDAVFGGSLRRARTSALLNSAPLHQLLKEAVDFDAVRQFVESGELFGFSICATNYKTGTAIVFFDGHPSIHPWTRSNRMSVREKLETKHVLASAAIPLFFSPVAIGESYYGDGGIRLTAPLSPVVHMGADKVLAIGIRRFRTLEETRQIQADPMSKTPSIAEVLGVVMNSVFMDSLETDVERLERINRTAGKNPTGELRPIDILVLRPSRDLGELAADQFQELPRTFQYLLSGVGASRSKGFDLLSYLAFDSSYTKRILSLGYQDALANEQAIRDFFNR